MPHDGPQPLHKDSLFAFKRHVRTHRPWTLLLFYYPQETPPERGPTGVIPGSQYALRHPGGDASSAFPLGGPAGTVAIGAFDVWHARMRNFTNQKRFMLKFLMSRMTLPTAPSWDCADDRWRDPEDAPQHYPLSPLWRGSWNWLAGKSMPAEATGSESLAELESRLEGDDESVSLSAAYELAGRGPAGIASLGRRLLAGTGDNLPEDETTAELGGRYAEDPAARAAAFGLGASDPAAAGPILAEATRSSSGVVRKMAAFALGEMRGDAARDAALVRAAGDSDPHVRIAARAVIRMCGSRPLPRWGGTAPPTASCRRCARASPTPRTRSASSPRWPSCAAPRRATTAWSTSPRRSCATRIATSSPTAPRRWSASAPRAR
jgi:hypothetical protein